MARRPAARRRRRSSWPGDLAEGGADRLAALSDSARAAAADAGVAAGHDGLANPLKLGTAEPADERAIQGAETAAARLARGRSAGRH